MALTNPAIQQLQGAIVDQGGVLNPVPYDYFQRQNGVLASVITVVNSSLGVNRFTLAGQPSLGAGDAGYVGFVTDYSHLVYWDGSAWQWLEGDRPGRFCDFDSDPGTGWGLCDGSTYAALVIGGASLTTRNIVTPNLKGSPAYKKSAAAYTGAITAASGTTGAGTTGTGTTGTGTTGTGTSGAGSAHHHTQNFNAPVTAGGVSAPSGGGGVSIQAAIVGNTDDESAHTHSIPGLSVPGLSVPGLSVPGLGPGSLDLAHLDVLVYVRR